MKDEKEKAKQKPKNFKVKKSNIYDLAPYLNKKVSIIFLLAVPELVTDDNLILALYDEMINLASDKARVAKIIGAGSYRQFLKALH